MTDDVRYTVKVRPARLGFIASVGKKTRLDFPLSEGDDWIGWSPEPTYWRPTEAWAVRRAARKKRRLEAADVRLAQIRVVS